MEFRIIILASITIIQPIRILSSMSCSISLSFPFDSPLFGPYMPLNPKPEALNPKPSTLNPKPLNPKPFLHGSLCPNAVLAPLSAAQARLAQHVLSRLVSQDEGVPRPLGGSKK